MRSVGKTPGGILSYFARHATLANLLLVMLLAAGTFAFPNMRAQFFPDVILDEINVNTTWDGAGPEDVDDAIVQVLEPVLLAVEGVATTTSTSREGSARIRMEFEPGWDMARAAEDVRVAVEAVTTLPEDAEEPEVRRRVWRDRVTDVVITGPVDAGQLGLFADEFITRLFAAGVSRTTIRGLAAPRTIVEVSSVNLLAHDISMSEIAAAIAAEVDADPAGDVQSANARVRTGVAKRAPEDLAAIVLRSNPDGSSLTIGDVAVLRVEGVDRARKYFVGSDPAISLRVDRSAQGDAIEVQGKVEEVAAQLQATLPQGVTIELIRTRAQAITSRLNILIDNGLMGLGLVLALLFLFLNARTAFWVAAGIPAAMFAAVALMYAGGLTINMVSLFGLIITLGIVVDDAIVVGEHADFRARRLKEGPFEAAENAARRMSMPVLAATLTTVIAFFGLTAIGGRFGDLIRDIPFTVIAVLLASLVECFLILPNHMAHALNQTAPSGQSRLRVGLAGLSLTFLAMIAGGLLRWLGAVVPPLSSVFDMPGFEALMFAAGAGAIVFWTGFAFLPGARRDRAVIAMSDHGIDIASHIVNRGFSWLRDTIFTRFIALVIQARYVVLAGAVLVLATQAVLFIDGDVRWRFFNAPERGSVTGNFMMTQGATREDSMDMMREMQRATEELAREYEDRYGRFPVDYVLAEIGGNAGRGLSGADNRDKDLLGAISIELIDADLRPEYSSFDFVADLQDRVARHPLAETVSFRGWRSGPGGDALDVQFFGADLATLKAASEDLKTALAQFPEVSAVDDNLGYDKEELILDLTPQGQALGFTIDALGRSLRARLGGLEAATYPDGPRSAEIRVELPESELSADFVDRMMMRTGAGDYVPLADIVSVTRRDSFSTVRRENGIRLISVTGDVSEDDPDRAALIQEALEQQILPDIASNRQVEWRLSGLSEQEDRFLAEAATGTILCLLGIYLVLAWVFASWTRPLVVMAIIPFGLVGTIYGHYIWEVPLSMFTVVGLLGMTGIIINDSIVLITTIDEYADRRGLVPAIIDAAADRLRPVLLTTLTTVLGLTPLLYEQSQQAQFLKPTVITLVYGLGFGMLLVLLVVPALVAIQRDVARPFQSLRRALRGPAGLRGLVSGGLVAMALWAVCTLGWTMVLGALPDVIRQAAPGVAGLVPARAALLLFLLGAGVICLCLYGAGLVGLSLRRRRASSSG